MAVWVHIYLSDMNSNVRRIVQFQICSEDVSCDPAQLQNKVKYDDSEVHKVINMNCWIHHLIYTDFSSDVFLLATLK